MAADAIESKLPKARRPLNAGHEALLKLIAEELVNDYLSEVEHDEEDSDDGRRGQLDEIVSDGAGSRRTAAASHLPH